MNVSFWKYVFIPLTALGLLGGLVYSFLPVDPLKGQQVLVFSKTAGFRHSSIPDGIKAIQKMGLERGFEVDTTENSAVFEEKNLRRYKVVIFLNTTGDVLTKFQQVEFERYIQAGGGYVGIHAATDTEYQWPWYNKLSGAYFASHPGNPNVQEGSMKVVHRPHPAVDSLPDQFKRTDEFYDFKSFNPDVKTLITVDENSYKEGKMGKFHPLSWFHEYDGGRAFYTNFGHTEATYTEPLFLKHLWGGLRWAADYKSLDYSKARSQHAPDESRFERDVLDEKLDEPTELAVFSDGRVIYVERKGRVRLYNPEAKPTTKTLAQLKVYSKFEYGLMGVAIDPEFEKNKWVYFFYSPESNPTDTAQRLVRMKFDPAKDSLHLNTEQVILRVPVKRDECCHTGGSLTWDKEGNLYISTGDDTNPFESDGYAPIDNRPGKSGWDARATSANTNDLRGKVLRIKPRADGGYDIPKGNLFSQGTEKTKPEIYVMGCRNPYRISVDSKTGRLFWGEVGPDAGENSEKYGPRGHDEVNMATKAGFYGWPLFVADNRAYARRDFVTKATGEFFDPAKPVNESPHNTGLTQLPPAQKALIYYPYDVSPEFGEVVTKGGRNAMAGPVYYTEDYDKKSKVKFPDYYNGKLFTYDWMRDWVLSVTLDKDGSIVDMERFLPNMPFSHPMDMQFGADGTLYLLEYGPNWFAQNDEARLTRIRFNAGNRAPVVEATLSKTAGAVPFTLQVDASKSFDHDKDALKYSWQMGKGQGGLKEAKGSYTFKEAGTYDVVLTVTDSKGASTVRHFEIQAGNEPPVVDVRIEGNQSFFWEKEPVKYAVNVVDKEDGQTSTAGIPNTDVFFDVQYLEGYDKTMIAQGHQKNGAIAAGKRLIELSDCKSCHALDKKSVGPTYLAIAEKYKTTNGAVNLLAEKIIKGGGGVWGEQAMSAHPQLTQAQAKEMTKYILSLGVKQVSTLPLAGNYVPAKSGAGGAYIFSAVYTDKGASKSVPQTSSSQMVLRPAKFSALQYDEQKGTMKFKSPQTGQDILVINGDKSQIVFKRVDLTGVAQVTMMANSITGMTAGGTIQLRQGSADGKVLGEVVVAEAQMTPVSIPLNGAKGFQDLYLVFVNPAAGSKPLMAVDWLQMDKAKAMVQ